MKFSDWLKVGTAGVLGAVGCGGDIDSQPPKDNVGIVQSAQSSLKVPQLSDLERKVSGLSPEESSKEGLLEQADYGERFHSSVSLFVGNYTLGVSSGWLGYRFEHQEKVEPWEIEKLRSNALAIRNNGEDNSAYTLRRCDAAEELYGIMKRAEKEGHLDEATKVIGYFDRASSRTQSVFSSFKFFYGNDSNNEGPRNILGRYGEDAAEVGDMTERARTAFGSLSEDVRSELTMWVGRYGHDALQGMNAETIFFKDNQPDRVTRARVLPDVPVAPTFGKDTFYRQFGENLLKGYGLVTTS
ncbi:MAG TPA: hypothetical protein HA294_01405 [Nanoarchaeota archaeon]|nr:hypothetical protein [Candidatus Woesearchaeota archaeon]HIH58639.1 hypothetical protein [Nanoarchaeota archaeon]